MEKIYKLTPSLHANMWGGTKLLKYGKKTGADRIGESWELSFVGGAEALLEDGTPITSAFPKSAWGENCRDFEFFPVLTKFIDARDKLSVQVHPDDEYAIKNEGQYGKSEMWYVVEADEGAGLYMGLSDNCTKEELRAAIEGGTVEKLLSFKKVKSGDVFFIPAGTIHAIGAGVLIYEIQQNSTLTYRLYDYMRRDKDGNLRELHVEKAMKVLSPTVYEAPTYEGKERVIGSCKYFKTKEYALFDNSAKIVVDNRSFLAITAVKGEGVLSFDGESGKNSVSLSLGDTYFIPAQSEPFELTLSGSVTAITVEV